MLEEKIELTDAAHIEEDVYKKVNNVGVRGLDINKVKELGLFDRISYSLCAMHASVVAAYRIYGDVDYLLSMIGAKKNFIAHACYDFEKSFDKFTRFWTEYYRSTPKEVSEETESLYHNIMRWAQLPEGWELGDDQRLEDDEDIVIKIERDGGRILNFHRCSVNVQQVEEPKESWCVLMYDDNKKKQTTIHTDMDKASALMVAKKLSNENKEYIYTAACVYDIVEKRTEVTPYKSFVNNNTIGTIKKVLRKYGI